MGFNLTNMAVGITPVNESDLGRVFDEIVNSAEGKDCSCHSYRILQDGLCSIWSRSSEGLESSLNINLTHINDIISKTVRSDSLGKEKKIELLKKYNNITELFIKKFREDSSESKNFSSTAAIQTLETSDHLIAQGLKILCGFEQACTDAVANGHEQVLRYLLGEEENSQIPQGVLAKSLACAVKNGHGDIVRLLLSDGRTISQKDLGVAVSMAAGKGDEQTIRYLLSDGRMISQDGVGLAVEEAVKNGHESIIRYLLSEGRTLSRQGLRLAVEGAARNGNEQMVRYFLAEEIEITKHYWAFAFIAAAGNGHKQMVDYLLSGGREISQECLDLAVEGAAINGHEQMVRYLLSEGREISQEVLSMAVVAAAGNGDKQMVDYLLSEGKEISQEILSRAVVAAAGNGDKQMVDYLLSEGKEISQECLDLAVGFATANGHEQMVRYLLSEGKEISQEYFRDVVAAAAANGCEQMVRYLLSEGREISQEILSWAVVAAAKNGEKQMVDYLLSEGGEFSRDGLGFAVEGAASNGQEQMVRYLLSEGREISQEDLGRAVQEAARNGQEQMVRYLLSEGREISQEYLGWAVEGAARNGQEQMVRYLLSEGREISQENLGETVKRAAEHDQEQIIRYLLSEGRNLTQAQIEGCINYLMMRCAPYMVLDLIKTLLAGHHVTLSQSLRERVVLQAAEQGDVELVEMMLRQGPISSSARDSAITQSSAIQGAQMRELLSRAEILEPGRVRGVSSNVLSSKGEWRVKLEDVKKECRTYLSEICEKGLPSRIYLEEHPEVIDLGGVTKQFISTLSQELIPHLSLTGENLPRSDREDLAIFKEIGRFFSLLAEKNRTCLDKTLTGEIFNPAFFELVKLVAVSKDEAELRREVATLLKREVPDYAFYFDCLLSPDNEELKSQYIRNNSEWDLGLEEDPFKGSEQIYLSFFRPVQAFYQGMSESFRHELLKTDPHTLSRMLQGERVSSELLLGALIPEGEGTDFIEKVEWIREKITSSDFVWNQKFLKTITGRESISPQTVIKIKPTWRTGGVFEIHTCFNSLDIPVHGIEKEKFLEGLDASIEDTKYNIS